MSQNILQFSLNKGKSHKDVLEALKHLNDYLFFYSNVSVALETVLQYLADSLFAHLATFVLLNQDSYLGHVKLVIKPDTWNQLRNAPLFGYGLFPYAAL